MHPENPRRLLILVGLVLSAVGVLMLRLPASSSPSVAGL